MDIMTALFDQKEVNRRYHLEIQRNAKAEGKAEDIVEVMKKLKCDFTEAMDFLNIPEDERLCISHFFNQTSHV